mmetsp:Transcript_19130/g.37767  ORF Transcript_19130/g.37767 Transcript_19130/m.37767 type:complete len:882 (-) Transcript_19130:2885-5530(-)
MAGRGAKMKEYRIQVTSVKHWLKEIDFDGLLVVEVYSSWFGSCQVIAPTINSIMMSITDADAKIKWPVINIAKLEEEQRELMMDEEKKKQELASVLRRKVGQDEGADVDAPPPGEDEEMKAKQSFDKVKIPKLEAYSGWEDARPLWLLMKDGEILHTLTSANPPKMMKLIDSVVNGTALNEEELAAMDFHDAPKKKTADLEEDGKDDKQDDQDEFVPSYIMSLSCKDLDKSDWSTMAPLIFVYEAGANEGEWVYKGQTEQVKDTANPNYNTQFFFPVPSAGGNLGKIKLVVRDVESDTSLENSIVFGERCVDMAEIWTNNDEHSMEFPLLNAEGEEASSQVVVKLAEAADPGYKTRFRVQVDCRDLPNLDAFEGNSNPVASLFVKDINHPWHVAIGRTEELRGETNPYFKTGILVDACTNFDRELKFVVQDADAYSIHCNPASIIGQASINLNDLTERLANTGAEVELKLLDIEGNELLAPGSETPATISLHASQVAIPPATDNTLLASRMIQLSLTCKGSSPADAANKPVGALFGFDGSTEDHTVFFGQTELAEVEGEGEIGFQKLFYVDSEIDTECLFRLHASAESINLRDKQTSDNTIKAPEFVDDYPGKGVEMVGQAKIDIRAVLAASADVGESAFATDIPLTDAEGTEIEGAVVSVKAKHVGFVDNYDVQLNCTNLPKSEIAKTDPIALLYKKNPVTGKLNLVSKTESVKNSPNPLFREKLPLKSCSLQDTTYKLQVFDLDLENPASFDEKNLLGEVEFNMSTFLASSSLRTTMALVKGEAGPVADEDGNASTACFTVEKTAGQGLLDSKIVMGFFCKDVQKPDWSGNASPIVALYTHKPGSVECDQYLGRTERIPDDHDPTYKKNLYLQQASSWG